MHVSLTPELERLVRDRVESGLYNNASEVIREALRLLVERHELRQLKLQRLRLELEKGEADMAAGKFTGIDGDDELHEFFRSL